MTVRITLAALALLMAASAHAQPIYRCGDAYSQAPCPQARLVDVADTRSAAQLADAKGRAANDRQQAVAMASQREAARNAAIKSERKSSAKAKHAHAASPDAPAEKKKAAKKTTAKETTAKKAAATKDFVAQVPGSRHKRGRA